MKPDQCLLLVQTLKKFMKITCVSGDSVSDSFAMLEADIGLAHKQSTEVAKNFSDLVIEKDIELLTESIKFGRCFFENIRKYIQYQSAGSINLLIYVILGSLLYGDPPIQPMVILFANCMIDYFGCLILASELPSGDNSILKSADTKPELSPKVFTKRMRFHVISSTIYIQLILLIMFYNGSLWC